MRKLFKFQASIPARDEVSAIFIAEESDVAGAVGKRIRYYQECEGILEACDFTPITGDPAMISSFERICGDMLFNPLDFIFGEVNTQSHLDPQPQAQSHPIGESPASS